MSDALFKHGSGSGALRRAACLPAPGPRGGANERPARPRRLQEQGAGKDGGWAGVLARPLFARAGDGGSASLAHLTALFVERHHALWKARAPPPYTLNPICMARPAPARQRAGPAALSSGARAPAAPLAERRAARRQGARPRRAAPRAGPAPRFGSLQRVAP